MIERNVTRLAGGLLLALFSLTGCSLVADFEESKIKPVDDGAVYGDAPPAADDAEEVSSPDAELEASTDADVTPDGAGEDADAAAQAVDGEAGADGDGLDDAPLGNDVGSEDVVIDTGLVEDTGATDLGVTIDTSTVPEVAVDAPVDTGSPVDATVVTD